MKPHSVNDSFGRPFRRIKKIPRSKEAYITSFDFRNTDTLPEEHVLKTFGSAFLNFFRLDKRKNISNALAFSFKGLSYNELFIPWGEIKGLYEFYENRGKFNRSYLIYIIIKTKDKAIHKIEPHFLNLDADKVGLLISAYRTRWEMAHLP